MITTEMTTDRGGGVTLELPPLFKVENDEQSAYGDCRFE
jgi:hypothetical protein